MKYIHLYKISSSVWSYFKQKQINIHNFFKSAAIKEIRTLKKTELHSWRHNLLQSMWQDV